MTRDLLGTIELRNEHAVYRDGTQFLVEHTDGKGQLHTTFVPDEAVRYLHESLGGREVVVEEAAEALEPVAERLDLPYTYGYKLNFYAQSILLVLVALGHADIEKVGRRYYYRLSVSE